MKIKSISVFLVLFSACVISCDMFTTSLAQGRNLSETLRDASVREIVDLLNSGQPLSIDESKDITNVLGEKSSEELNSLSSDDKATVLNTAASGILPSPADVLDFVTGDNATDLNEDQMTTFINSIVNDAIELVDETVSTKAIETFFDDEEVIKDILFDSPDALLLGMVSLTVSIAKENNALESASDNDDSLQKIFGQTFVSLDTAFQSGGAIDEAEKKAAADILAASLNTDAEDVESLVNVATVLLTAKETEGLDALGVFENVFNDLIGSEIPSTP